MRGKCLFVLLLIIVGGLLAGGCALLNRAPVAVIEASVLSGPSPLRVDFDGTDSYDPDNDVITYEWDFDDDTVKTGPKPSHTFTTLERRTFHVSLTVADDSGAEDTTNQSIEVYPGTPDNPNAPTASFTATPNYGNAPLLITLDGTGSRAVDGLLKTYAWDFGDGETGSGATLTHSYDPLQTTNYTVTLTVMDYDGASASTSRIVTAFVPEEILDDPPVASFVPRDVEKVHDGNPPDEPSLFEVTFDPSASEAALFHDISVYHWQFGDGESSIRTNNDEFVHVYELVSQSRIFVVTLIVIDDQGLENSMSANVTLTQ